MMFPSNEPFCSPKMRWKGWKSVETHYQLSVDAALVFNAFKLPLIGWIDLSVYCACSYAFWKPTNYRINLQKKCTIWNVWMYHGSNARWESMNVAMLLLTNSIQLFLHGEANPPPLTSLFLSNSFTGKRGKLLAVLAEQKNCSSI